MNVILSPSRLERIEMLRQNMLVEPQVCVEKALYTTESFRSTEGAPIEYRRARALDHVLTHLTVGIGPGELFVGRPTGKDRGNPWVSKLTGTPRRWIPSTPGNRRTMPKCLRRTNRSFATAARTGTASPCSTTGRRRCPTI